MLWALLRQYVRPYRWLLAVVAALQLISSLASLYLPTINAAIIDDGVAKGDTGTITELGGIMLGVTALQVVCAIGAVYFGSRAGMGFGRDLRSAIFHHVTGLSAEETARFGAPTLLTRTTNDVQQIQLLVAVDLHHADHGADHEHRRHRDGRAPECRAVLAVARQRAAARAGQLLDRRAPAATVPHHAGPDRRHQSRDARTVVGHPGDPRVRAGTDRTGPVRRRPTRRCRTPRSRSAGGRR